MKPLLVSRCAQLFSSGIAGIFFTVGTAAVTAQTPAISVAQVIATIAGNGNSGADGDGGSATSAMLAYAQGVALDAAGNIYIADTGNNRVRKIDRTGLISTVAGNGDYCPDGTLPCGDGGLAINAQFGQPYGVAVDAAGNIYIADMNDNRVRKVNVSDGTISTVAGNGHTGFSGDGGQATNATITYAYGVAVDAGGNIYILDQGNERVRKVNPSGIISTVAGSQSGGFSGDGGPATSAEISRPYGIATDAAGNFYIADTFNNRIRKVTVSTGVISTIAGGATACPDPISPCGDGGQATAALLSGPYGIAVDAAGNIYFADRYNSRVRKVSTNGIISTVAGNGTDGSAGDGGRSTNAELSNPYGVAVNAAGDIYLADSGNSRIRKVSQSLPGYGNIPLGVESLRRNIYLTINQPVTITSFDFPRAEGGQMELDYNVDGCPLNVPLPAGTLCTIPTNFMPAYVGKRDAPLIVTTSGNGKFSFGLTGTGVAPLVAFVPGVISTVAGNGQSTYSGEGVPATSAGIAFPQGMSRDAAGNMYIADSSSSRVRKVDPSQTITTFAGNGVRGASGDGGKATDASLLAPADVVPDASGNVYIVDRDGGQVRKVDINGTITTFAGTGSAGPIGDNGPAIGATLTIPSGAAVDATGNVYIADSGHHSIRKVDVNGIITTIAGTGTPGFSGDNGPAFAAQFNSPQKIAVSRANELYIADQTNNRVRKVDVNGIITTVAGNGTAAFSGDGGPATNASLTSPAAVTLDAAGGLYILDHLRVRKVDANGIITTIAGNGVFGSAGDGGSATSAQLGAPLGIAIDTLGNIFTADSFTSRVRKITTAAAPLMFSDTTIGQTSSTLQTVGVSNIGNGELNLAGLVTSTEFFVDPSGTCGGALTLSVGTSCNLTIGFKPQQTGQRTGTATVTDDALNVPGSTQTVQLSGDGIPIDTTIVLSLSTSSSIDASTPVTLTANITPFSPEGLTRPGVIAFFDNNIPLSPGGLTISPTGEASFTVPSFAVGTHPLTAIFNGNLNFNASESTVVLLTVTAAPVAVSLISSDNPSAYGQLVRFTATVPSVAAGSIQFMIDGAPLGGPVTLVGTTATFPTSTLGHRATPYVVTALYRDGLSNPVATSAPLNQNVLPATLTVTPVNTSRPYATPNPDFNYTISGFIPGETQAVVSGAPTITTTATSGSPVGDYPITASLGSLAAANYTFQLVPATLTVTKATPAAGAVGLACSPNPSVWGQMVTCTATLSANATGQVNFMEGAASVGSGAIVDEHASFSTTQLAVATHRLMAAYGGDTNYNATNSPVVPQVVNKATLSVMANDQQRLYGQPNPTFTTIMSGFVNGDTGAVVTGGPSVTTTATTTSPPGAYPITVAQGTLAAANYNFVAVNGALFVAAAAAAVTIASSAPSVPLGTPVTFTATVTAGATGTVQFYDGTTVIGTGNISGGKATLTTSTLMQGTHPITAVYGGDANFTAASSPALTETITATVVADYTVSSNTPRQLIPPGASATYNIIVSSVSAPFANPVALTASNLPPGATYTFTPSTVTPGAAGTTSSFIVSVPKQTAGLHVRGMVPMAMAVMLSPLFLLRRNRSGPPRLLLWTLLTLAGLGSLAGCGTGGYFSQSEQTYTITVTGTSASSVRSTTVTLTVE